MHIVELRDDDSSPANDWQLGPEAFIELMELGIKLAHLAVDWMGVLTAIADVIVFLLQLVVDLFTIVLRFASNSREMNCYS